MQLPDPILKYLGSFPTMQQVGVEDMANEQENQGVWEYRLFNFGSDDENAPDEPEPESESRDADRQAKRKPIAASGTPIDNAPERPASPPSPEPVKETGTVQTAPTEGPKPESKA